MLGRTNASGGGGLLIDGTEVQYEVKSGSTIFEGDFVQLEDTVVTDQVDISVANQSIYSFSLSDGKEVSFYVTFANYPYTLNALLEEITSEGVISESIEVVVSSSLQTDYRSFMTQAGIDRFIYFEGRSSSFTQSGTTYYYLRYYMYVITYNPLTGEFSSASKGEVATYCLVQTSTSANNRTWPYLFVPVYVGNDKLLITHISYNDPQTTTGWTPYGFLHAFVYNLSNDTKTTPVKVGSFSGTDYAVANQRNDLYTAYVNNLFIYCKRTSSAGQNFYVLKYNSSNDSLTSITASFAQVVERMIPVANDKVLVCTSSIDCYLYTVEESGFTMEKHIIAPFVIDRTFGINSKLFAVKPGDYSAANETCQILYDGVADEVSFSAVSTGMVFLSIQRVLEITSQYFSTYERATRKTVKENNGLFVALDNSRKVKAYSNRIDGVAIEDGIGGDTITIIVPTT